MLSFFENVRNGTVESKTLISMESTRRMMTLQLSKYRDVERSHTAGVNSLDIDPVEGRYLLSGSADGSIYIHDLENRAGKPEYTCNIVCKNHGRSQHGHRYSVEKVQWYPFDTGLFLSSGRDCRLKVWNTNSMTPAEEVMLRHNIYTHHMSPVGTSHFLIAVVCAHPHVVLVDLKSGSHTHELRGLTGEVMSVQWSPWNENLLAAGSSKGTLLLWDIRSAKGYLKALDQHNGEAMSGSVKPLVSAHDGRVNGLHFTSDGLNLISFGTDNRLRVWDVAMGKNTMVNFGKVKNESRKSVQISVSSNLGQPIVFAPSNSGTAGTMYAFGVNTGLGVDAYQGHFSSVNCCIAHPHYPEVYSGGNDQNIVIWVDGSAEEAYEEHLHSGQEIEAKIPTNALVKRKTITADAWSSEED